VSWPAAEIVAVVAANSVTKKLILSNRPRFFMTRLPLEHRQLPPCSASPFTLTGYRRLYKLEHVFGGRVAKRLPRFDDACGISRVK
jgi:hypothetical protein